MEPEKTDASELSLEALDLGIDLRRTVSVTAFRQKASELIEETVASNRPLLLTTNGASKAVVVGVELFQQLFDLADEAVTLHRLRRGLDEAEHGETRPAEDHLADLNRKHASILD